MGLVSCTAMCLCVCSGAKAPAKGAAPPPAATASPAERLGTPKRATCAESVNELVAKVGGGAGKAIVGSDHVPSAGEWQQLITQAGSSGHVFCGLGAALSCLPAAMLVGLDATPTCKLAILADKGVNAISSRRVARQSSQRSSDELSLESASSTAALLSLAGVGTIVVNQWATSCTANDALLRGVLTALSSNSAATEKPVTVAEAVRIYL